MTAGVLIGLAVEPERLAAFRARFPGCDIAALPPIRRGTELPAELIRDRNVLIADFPPVNLAEMKRLVWMQLGAAGYQHLDGFPLAEMGVRVTNASGVNDVPIAEWCLLMMLAWERNLPAIFRLQQNQGWERPARFQSELRGRRVGILGYGNIGREVARLSRAIGLDVWAMNRTPVGPSGLRYAPAGTGDPDGTIPSRAFTFDQMEAFLSGLDVLVVTAALNRGTRGLIGERELRLLPSHAVVLNPARGALIDEEALERALREGWIAGVAIDSHYREPMHPGDPVWSWPNTILTPHISGSSESPHYRTRLWELAALNLERHLAGQPLLNEIRPSDLTGG